jgi:hypothetical protein
MPIMAPLSSMTGTAVSLEFKRSLAASKAVVLADTETTSLDITSRANTQTSADKDRIKLKRDIQADRCRSIRKPLR